MTELYHIFTLTEFKIFAALSIILVTIASGWKPLRDYQPGELHHHFSIGEAFAGGVFLGAGLFHMLPDAAVIFHQVYGDEGYIYANFLCGLGFLLLLFLDKVVVQLAKISHRSVVNYVPVGLAIALSLHEFITGAAFGINTTLASAAIIYIAMITHKGSESFALATMLRHSLLSKKSIITIFAMFTLITPLGIILGAASIDLFASTTGSLLRASCNAVAAGTFLYIATLHNLAHHEDFLAKDHLMQFLFLCAGLVIMGTVAIYI